MYKHSTLGLVFFLCMAHASAQSLFDPENARVEEGRTSSAETLDAASEATPERPATFPLTPENGPIMVKVASFVGEKAGGYAGALATELRERYKLAAYTFRYEDKVNDISEAEAKKFKDQYNVEIPRYVPLVKPPTNWVVLIGDFESYDDREAQRTLDRVRKLAIESVPAEAFKAGRGSLGEGKILGDVRHKQHLTAPMLVRNPALPRTAQQLSTETLRMLSEMNSNSPHSIYSNPHPYTLVVAQFQGGVMVGESKNKDKGVLDKIFGTKEAGLARAGDNAIELANALRKLGWEAFVFHGQYASLVCVGGFPERLDLKDPQLRDPRVRSRIMSEDPEVQDLRKKLGAVTVGGMPLAPYAELIVTPRPPNLEQGQRRAN